MPKIVAYIIFDDKENKFVGCDTNSGNYPWKSNTLSMNGMLWRSKQEAEDYKNIRGFRKEPFNSSNWRVRGLIVTDSI